MLNAPPPMAKEVTFWLNILATVVSISDLMSACGAPVVEIPLITMSPSKYAMGLRTRNCPSMLPISILLALPPKYMFLVLVSKT